MSAKEYQAALLQAVQISKLLTAMPDDNAQDLFEAYGEIHERIVKYECQNHA